MLNCCLRCLNQHQSSLHRPILKRGRFRLKRPMLLGQQKMRILPLHFLMLPRYLLQTFNFYSIFTLLWLFITPDTPWGNTLATSGIEVEGFSSSTVLEASFGSTEISSFWWSADEGLVDADLNARDKSSAPRVGWDAMVDNYKERSRIRDWISFWEEDELFYLSSWWSRSVKPFPSNGFLGCPLGCLAFWRLVCYNCRNSMGFH